MTRMQAIETEAQRAHTFADMSQGYAAQAWGVWHSGGTLAEAATLNRHADAFARRSHFAYLAMVRLESAA